LFTTSDKQHRRDHQRHQHPDRPEAAGERQHPVGHQRRAAGQLERRADRDQRREQDDHGPVDRAVGLVAPQDADQHQAAAAATKATWAGASPS
jgi:hypothetical protein